MVSFKFHRGVPKEALSYHVAVEKRQETTKSAGYPQNAE